ncbi:hypothetical protein M378DRAFT_544142 [Amanita muscaria Koide BX008]|uniref:Uncharacterized protein n=1 Tax=Amanita muscaria (strain Koide BX008) TaxID=946122 RepID=A0A0C2X8Q3_AMAMK|nr:hypothetical protein M378DRAFT_544142 [Amanita muscaria Koide BX008]
MRLSTSSITYLSWLTHIASNHSLISTLSDGSINALQGSISDLPVMGSGRARHFWMGRCQIGTSGWCWPTVFHSQAVFLL